MLILLPSLIACARPGPLLLLPPDDTRTGALGTDGPDGAALLNLRYDARVVDAVDVEWVYPSDETAAPVRADAPTVVFVQGGLVTVDRYRWLAIHLASRGYNVLSPTHPLDLAIFTIGNAEAALDGALDDPDLAPWIGGPVFVGGHSLGGVVAVKNWLADDRFDGVVLLASYPAAGDDPADRAGSPVLALAGSTDESALAADVEAGFERFSAPRTFGLVDGMNHYAWTDDATADELAADGPVEDLALVRAHALSLLDAWLDSDGAPTGAFSGVEVHQ